jgi:hypothetical protein
MSVDIEVLRRYVTRLAASPRPGGSPTLAALRDEVSETLSGFGWIVERQSFTAPLPSGSAITGINLVAQHADHPCCEGPRLCVGAHLDSREETPGADDNASAVAALLEIARLLPDRWPESARLEIELAVFDLEELGMLGGADRARRCRRDQIDLRGMVSLEMLGYSVNTP